jgi:hypothetical protein
VSLFSSIKSIGRAIDPTSSKAPLGGLVKSALPYVPIIGPAANTALDVAKTVKAATGSSRAPGSPVMSSEPMPGATPLPPSPNAPPRPAASQVSAFLARVATPVGLAVVAVLVVVLVVLRGRRS